MSSLEQMKKKTYWRSFGQLKGDSEYLSFLHREFQEGASELGDVSRRNFIKLMGASAAFAGLTGCTIRRPVQKIRPYAKMPEYTVPGKAQFYASSTAIGDEVVGVLVEAHEGRPTKIEGHPEHAKSLGATRVLHQASILNLYDPDRLLSVIQGEKKQSVSSFSAWVSQHMSKVSEQRGEGVCILTETQVSPLFSQTLKQFLSKYPKATVFRYDPINRDNQTFGIQSVTGQYLDLVPNFQKADIVVSFGSDFLGKGFDQVANTKAFSKRRDPDDGEMNRLYTFESGVSLTGSKSDHRIPVKSTDLEGVVWRVADALVAKGVVSFSYDLKVLLKKGARRAVDVDTRVITAIVDDLTTFRGKSILIAGEGQSSATHALVYALNRALGNLGRTIRVVSKSFSDIPAFRKSSLDSISELVTKMNSGQVKSLFVLGGDPVLNAPADVDFSSALDQVETVVCLSHGENATTQKADWVVPRSHYLESWSDLQSNDGVVSVVQPVIRPVGDSLSDSEFVNRLLGGSQSGYSLLRRSYRSRYSNRFEDKWKKALHDGILDNASVSRRSVLSVDALSSVLRDSLKAIRPTTDLELVFSPSATLLDGRYANNGWLQETPDPITKITWDNAALMSQKTAKRLGLSEGKLIDFSVDGRTLRLPLMIVPGHVENSVEVQLGYGQSNVGRVGSDVGVNVYPMRILANYHWVPGVTVSQTKETYQLASTQEHGSMEGRPLYRESSVGFYREHPTYASEMVETPPLKSSFPELPYDKGYQWGMVIDLSKCTGCQACVVGCQAENNIPIVGKEEVLNGREMHWIRIDRYFEGDVDSARTVHQPVTCLQCELAPCEQVCPVAATTHTEEGLNDMTYNRCVGTRYCLDNCPAKVRRFNFFDYNQRNPQSVKKDRQHLFDYMREPDPLVQQQFNPDVTVRMRGMMEKCTYCVQRISSAKKVAKNESRLLKDGEVVTACQQVCPADAISFGSILDKKGEVYRQRNKHRHYHILEQLHLKPRTTYLAGVLNPHPLLENTMKKAVESHA